MFSKKLHFIYILVPEFGGGGETHRETLKMCHQGILGLPYCQKGR